MAKKRRGKAEGGTLGDVAEGLGRILGQAEAQWRAQRHNMVATLTAVRDRASALLAELGVGKPPPPPSRTARVVAAVRKVAKKVGRRSFTPAQKAETSRRMKAYWAARRKDKGK